MCELIKSKQGGKNAGENGTQPMKKKMFFFKQIKMIMKLEAKKGKRNSLIKP